MDYQIKPIISVGNFIKILHAFDFTNKKVVILTSKSVFACHNIEEILSNVEVQIFSDVTPELPFSYIRNFYYNLKFYPDIIVAIGGGSVLDMAKAISVSGSYKQLEEFFYKQESIYNKKAKVIAIPGTFGTGAEMSFGSILYDDTQNIKGGLRSNFIQPEYVIIDPAVYASAPPKIMAEAGFDCLTHAIETYISNASNVITRYQSIVAIHTVFDHLEKAVIYRETDSIIKMAISSMFMGINLAYSSTCLPHRIQYVIGPFTKTSHAQGLIMLYRGWLKLLDKDLESKSPLNSLLDELKLNKREFLKRIKCIKNKLDINYRLSDFGVNEKDISFLAKKVTGNLTNDPYYEDINTIKEVIQKSL